MFEAEKTGLEEIKRSESCPVPFPVKTGTQTGISYLLQPFINRIEPSQSMWSSFGHDLAKMHALNMNYYGYQRDNYLGSLLQKNGRYTDWHEFLIEHRLKSQFDLAAAGGYMDRNDRRRFDRICKRIRNLIPAERPSLLHGDLWIGNCIPSDQGRIFIIDPAVYWGHREMDLAMSDLFGGFHSSFYSAYQERYPLIAGYDERKELYQLYYLVAHVNLFGHTYVNSVRNIIRKYS